MTGPRVEQILGVLLLAASTTAACGPSQEEFDAERRRVSELGAERDAARTHIAELDARVEGITAENGRMADRLRALGQDLEAVSGDRAAIAIDLEQTRRAFEEVRAREAQAQARIETFRSMLERFRSMIAAGRLRVRIVRNRMVVELPEGILFDSGRAELKDSGETTLTEVATVLNEISNRQFQVAGHTDNVPIRSATFPSNWELSTRRAVNVARFLIAQSLDPARLSAAGYADTQPVAANDTPEGRAQNRRIEIALVPNLDELPDLSSLESLGN